MTYGSILSSESGMREFRIYLTLATSEQPQQCPDCGRRHVLHSLVAAAASKTHVEALCLQNCFANRLPSALPNEQQHCYRIIVEERCALKKARARRL